MSFILALQLEGEVKEPVTLFEKSRKRRPRCHGLSDLCRHRSGWARCDQNMDWSDCKSAPLHADVRSNLSVSSAIQPLAASEERWHRLFIYLSIYLFIYLFLYIFGSSFLLSVWLIWDMSSQTIPDNLSVTGPWMGLVYEPPFFPYLFVYFFLIFSLIFGFVSPSAKIAQESAKSTIVWCHWKGVVHLLCRSTPVFWNDSIWEGPWVPLTI